MKATLIREINNNFKVFYKDEEFESHSEIFRRSAYYTPGVDWMPIAVDVDSTTYFGSKGVYGYYLTVYP
jgi:hypothetical protein